MTDSSTTPNILFIVLDSVRAKNTSLLGYHRETTPNIEAMDGTTYTNARAPSVWSLPSHISMFTGMEAHQHGLAEPDDTLDSTKPLIASQLQEVGYETGAFTDNVFVSMMENGMPESFSYLGPQNETAFFESALSPNGFMVQHGDDADNRYVEYVKQALLSGRPVRSVLNGALWKLRYMDIGERFGLDRSNDAKHHAESFVEWIDGQEDDSPWFSFMNIMDTHEPYAPVDEFSVWEDDDLRSLKPKDKTAAEYYESQSGFWVRKAMENVYDGTIMQADAAIGWLIDSLKERGVYEDTLIIVTADHGECFVDQSELVPSESLISHRHGVVEELLHVPLKVKYPGQSEQVVDESLAPLTNLYDLISSYGTGSGRVDITAQSAQMFAKGDRRGGVGRVSEALKKPLYVSYEQDADGSLVKLVSNGEQIRQYRVFSPWSKVEEASDVAVDEFCSTFESDSSLAGDAGAETDEAVEERLEDLGYM